MPPANLQGVTLKMKDTELVAPVRVESSFHDERGQEWIGMWYPPETSLSDRQVPRLGRDLLHSRRARRPRDVAGCRPGNFPPADPKRARTGG